MLPADFRPWQTVYWWFPRLVRRLLFCTSNDITLTMEREREGREQSRHGGRRGSASIKALAESGALMHARRSSVLHGTLLSIPIADCS